MKLIIEKNNLRMNKKKEFKQIKNMKSFRNKFKNSLIF